MPEAAAIRTARRRNAKHLPVVRVKGKTEPVEVFAVLGERDRPPPPGLGSYEEAMSHYREGRFGEAAELFSRSAVEGLDDKLTEVFLARATALCDSPPDSWDGVFTMTKK